MNLKQILTLGLLLLAGGSVLYVLLGDTAGPEAGAERASTAQAAPTGDGAPADVIVYYMDMGKDCTTCLHLETYTHEALTTHFSDELASGRIAWRRVDLDEPQNAHFVAEFQLYTKSVVLVRQVEGAFRRFDSLSRIWELVYDKEAYIAYVRDEVQGFLDAPEAVE